jgi:phosphatidylserine decarboxylase
VGSSCCGGATATPSARRRNGKVASNDLARAAHQCRRGRRHRLSFLDVHVNRAPIAGDVAAQRRYPGRFGPLEDPASVFANERATTVLERSGETVIAELVE